jgi:dTMP kinase
MGLTERGCNMLVVIEGVDGSGKETQSLELHKRLNQEGIQSFSIGFPRYSRESSTMVKKYLNGDFGKDAKQVDPYIASTFYASDRYASYVEEFGFALDNGMVVIADRYTTSNMVHQAGKFDSKQEKDRFLDWLCAYEYELLKLPKPDLVIFLNMPLKDSLKLTSKRKSKDGVHGDIHERDKQHLEDSYSNSLYVADKYGWVSVDCIRDGSLRTIEDINNEIFKIVSDLLRKNKLIQ